MAAIIQSFSVLGFFFMLAVPVGMVALLVWVAMRTRVRANMVAATPTSNVGFATDGYVELEGKAEAVNGVAITTPLTGVDCVWYHAKLERYVRTAGKDNRDWSVIREVTSSEPFLLKDGTGMCIVLPWGAEMTFTDRSVWFGSTPEPTDKSPERKGPGEAPEGNLTIYGTPGKEYRYTEERVYAGDPLYALGEFSSQPWEPGEWDEDDEEADEEGTDEQVAGTQDVDEETERGAWDQLDRYFEVGRQAAKLTSRRIQRPKSKPYLLSTTPQAKLLAVHSKGWKGALFVAIVPAAIVVLLLWLRFG